MAESAPVARGIAKSLLPSLGGDAEPPAILELFATGKGDLSNEVKTALASYVYGCAVVFDSATGLLSDTPDPPPSNAAPLSAPRLSDPYRHPSAKVAAAWDNYQAELQAYIGPPPARPRPSPHTEFGRTKTSARVEIVAGRRNVAPNQHRGGRLHRAGGDRRGGTGNCVWLMPAKPTATSHIATSLAWVGSFATASVPRPAPRAA